MPQWVSIKYAIQELGVSHAVITRLIKKKVISTKADEIDRRVVLVDLDELKQLYNLRQDRNHSE